MASVKTEPWDVGDEVVIYADFVDATGAPATPTNATLQIEEPDGTELATIQKAAMANPSTGRLEYPFTITKHGRYYYRWAATGAFKIAIEGSFGVTEPRLTTPAP